MATCSEPCQSDDVTLSEQACQYDEEYSISVALKAATVDRSSQHVYRTSEVGIGEEDCVRNKTSNYKALPYATARLQLRSAESGTSVPGFSVNPCSQTSEYARACITFTRNLHNSLLLFNHEMSNALQTSISGINDICLRVRDCLQEMDLQDSLYETIKAAAIEYEPTRSCNAHVPSVHALRGVQSPCGNVIVPVVTQSDNQMRVVMDVTCGTLNGMTTVSHDSSTEEEEDMAIEQMQTEFNQCLQLIKDNIESASVALIKEKEPIIIKPYNRASYKNQNQQQQPQRKSNPTTTNPTASTPKQQLRSVGEYLKQAAERLKEKDKDKQIICKDAIVDKSRATQDLHKKMLKQLEATDSLCEFERHIKRHPGAFKGGVKPNTTGCGDKDDKEAKASHKSSKTRSKSTHKAQQKSKKSQSPVPNTTKYADSFFFKPSSPPAPSPSHGLSPPKVTVENVGRSLFKRMSLDRYRSHLMRINSLNLKRHNNQILSCVDILDELEDKDLEPILSEYPRKDNYTRTHNVTKSFLYQFLYGRDNQQMLELLTTRQANRNTEPEPRKWIITNVNLQSKQIASTPSESQSTNKRAGKLAQKGLVGEHVAKTLRPYIVDPTVIHNTQITVMPVQVTLTHNPLVTSRTQSPLAAQRAAKKVSSTPAYLYTSGDFLPCSSKEVGKEKMDPKARQVSPQKLWEKKHHQKTSSQHLVTHLERQDLRVPEKLPARPSTTPSKRPIPQSSTNPKQLKATPAKKNIKATPERHHVINMDTISEIIQTTESRMVDLLSVPKDQKQVVCQNLEKEIRSVMQMLSEPKVDEKSDSTSQKAVAQEPASPDTSEATNKSISSHELDDAHPRTARRSQSETSHSNGSSFFDERCVVTATYSPATVGAKAKTAETSVQSPGRETAATETDLKMDLEQLTEVDVCERKDEETLNEALELEYDRTHEDGAGIAEVKDVELRVTCDVIEDRLTTMKENLLTVREIKRKMEAITCGSKSKPSTPVKLRPVTPRPSSEAYTKQLKDSIVLTDVVTAESIPISTAEKPTEAIIPTQEISTDPIESHLLEAEVQSESEVKVTVETQKEAIEVHSVEIQEVQTSKDAEVVTSEEFLTPFMQALTQHRRGVERKSSSYESIVDFLDRLTRCDDYSQNFSVVEGYLLKVRSCFECYVAEVYDQVEVMDTIVVAVNEVRKVEGNAVEYLARVEEDVPLVRFVRAEEEMAVWYKVKIKEVCVGDMEAHAQLLNTVYSVIFSLAYLAISFDFRCL